MALICHLLRLVTRSTSATFKQHFQYLPNFSLSLNIAPAVQVYKVKCDVNAPNFNGAIVEHESSSQSQVLLMASSCWVEARLLGTDREEHLSHTRAAVALSVKGGPGMSLAVAAVGARQIGGAVLGPCASVRACLHLSLGK